MNTLTVFNKSCGNLSEIKDDSIDIIITSPPYNIRHRYLEYEDNLNKKDYLEMIETMLYACFRVLKKDGLFVFDIAECIFWGSEIWWASNFIKSRLKNIGFSECVAYPYIAHDASSSMNKDDDIYFSSSYTHEHSRTQTVIVCSMDTSLQLSHSSPLRTSYIFGNNRDEAFWPLDLVLEYIKVFNLEKKTILDPFMGSGLIGLESLKRGSRFIGYEVSETLCMELDDAYSRI